MILESIKTVFKELRLNKLRTFLTMLGIIVGIFSISIIFALSNATKNYMSKSISSIENELTQVSVMAETNTISTIINNELNDYIKNNNKIDKMSKSTLFSYYEYDQIIKTTDNLGYEYSPGNYFAIDENYLDLIIMSDKLLYGRLLSKKDIINKMPYIVIREDTAINLFGKNNVVGNKLNINNNELEIIGVLKHDNNGLFDVNIADIYISYYYAINYMKTLPVTNYYFLPSKNEYTEEIKSDIKKILNEYISSDNYYVFSVDLDSIMNEVDNIVGIVELVFIGIASLSIIVGGIGIMNIMLVSVSERIKETGIRMALGAKNSDIVFQFLIEGIMLTIFSGIIGILIALLVSKGVNFAIIEYTKYKFTLLIDISTMIKIIIFCGLIGIIFGIYPAIKAGKLDPVEALKFE